ncbi:adenosine deaminase [Spiractinospora alimapuensis]|uniref:adenosine deaminase n=1 Tax=Spiractinospora alimapuensis TaxID=2820884 RepID=UPI001EEBEE68|nr:adenosine deaminase [Spiractinospora alimapuensis]QVQ50350.1 adenosine deaminase [Spiractinospora alimapuensis]
MSDLAPIDAFVADLPKVELHVHLEGSMRPHTLMRLAAKHGVAGVPSSPEELAEWYEFSDFEHFVQVYLQAVEVLREEEDFAALTADVAGALAAQNVRYAELHVSLYTHLMRGIPASTVFAGLEAARLEAERTSGIRLRWIPDFPGQFGVESGTETLDAVLAHGPDSVLGFGVGGIEVDRDQFEGLYGRARAAGLRSLPHAGENSGPRSVWSAINKLHAERIGHGIDAMRDPELVAYLRDTQLPLDVSPTSNVCTRGVASLEEHPLPQMVEAGLKVTLNTDDPPMFGTDLLREYRVAHDLGFDDAGLARLAGNGVDASFLPDEEKDALRAEIDATLARHRAPESATEVPR